MQLRCCFRRACALGACEDEYKLSMADQSLSIEVQAARLNPQELAWFPWFAASLVVESETA
eukprot:384445-Pleurochrysis_carterae.AAC.2